MHNNGSLSDRPPLYLSKHFLPLSPLKIFTTGTKQTFAIYCDHSPVQCTCLQNGSGMCCSGFSGRSPEREKPLSDMVAQRMSRSKGNQPPVALCSAGSVVCSAVTPVGTGTGCSTHAPDRDDGGRTPGASPSGRKPGFVTSEHPKPQRPGAHPRAGIHPEVLLSPLHFTEPVLKERPPRTSYGVGNREVCSKAWTTLFQKSQATMSNCVSTDVLENTFSQ